MSTKKTLDIRDRPLQWLLAFACGERLKLLSLLIDKGCVTYGDAADLICSGELDDAILEQIINVNDNGASMPPMLVNAAVLKLECFYR